MNKSNSNNSSKRFKSPVLQHSITIVRPDRPLISRKREDSESEFEEELPPVVETEDMLSSVLGKFTLNSQTVGWDSCFPMALKAIF